MGKLYNFIFNSAVSASTDNNNKSFYTDWSILPENKSFKVTFTMFSSSTASMTTAQQINIYCDLGQMTQTVSGGGTTTQYRSGFFGNVYSTGTQGRIICYNYDNPPIFLFRKPTTNNVNIQIRLNDNTFFNFGFTQGWVISMTFEEYD